MTSSSTFSLFPKLPVELRLMIWRATLPGPRAVRIHPDKDLKEYRSSTPVPVALHVSQESRFEAQRFYKLTIGPRNDEKLEDRIPGGRIYFDFSIDTLLSMPPIKSCQVSCACGGYEPGMTPCKWPIDMDDSDVFGAIAKATAEKNDKIPKLEDTDLEYFCNRQTKKFQEILDLFEFATNSDIFLMGYFSSNSTGCFLVGTSPEVAADSESFGHEAILRATF